MPTKDDGMPVAEGVLDPEAEGAAPVGAASDPPDEQAVATRDTAARADAIATSLREFRTIAACFQSSLATRESPACTG